MTEGLVKPLGHFSGYSLHHFQHYGHLFTFNMLKMALVIQ
jgi:hypothetical protein